MKQKFHLSLSNKIYFFIVAVLPFGLAIVLSDKSPLHLGEIIGELFIKFLLPALLALTAWSLFRRSARAASYTFNTVLTLILLSQLYQLGLRSDNTRHLDNFVNEVEEYRQTLSAAENTETIDSVHSAFAEQIKSRVDSLEASASGSEKQTYSILNDFMSESATVSVDLRSSIETVTVEKILSYPELDSDVEYEQRRASLRLFIEKTNHFSQYHIGMIADLENKLGNLAKESEFAAGALAGATRELTAQRQTIEPLLETYIVYANNLLDILNLLQKYKSDWTYVDEELDISNDYALQQYNIFVESLFEAIEKIESLETETTDSL